MFLTTENVQMKATLLFFGILADALTHSEW